MGRDRHLKLTGWIGNYGRRDTASKRPRSVVGSHSKESADALTSISTANAEERQC